MNRFMMEEFHNDPALRSRLFRDARRERTRAIGDGLVWLLGRPAWLLGLAKKHLAPHLHPSRWIARLG